MADTPQARIAPVRDLLLAHVASAWRCAPSDFSASFVLELETQLLVVYRSTTEGYEIATPLWSLLDTLSRTAALSRELLACCKAAVLEVHALAQDERDTGRWQIPPTGVKPR